MKHRRCALVWYSCVALFVCGYSSTVMASEHCMQEHGCQHRYFQRTLSESVVEGSATIASSEISSPVLFKPQNFNVLHYLVELNLNDAPKLQTTGSRCTMSFVWTSTPDTFRFHLRSLTIDSCYFEKRSGSVVQQIVAPFFARSTPTEADYHFAVAASADQKSGDTVQLVVVYSGTMTGEPLVSGSSWGGVSLDQSDAVYALGVGFKNNYVSCSQHWMPCFDLPSDKASFSLVAKCPEKYTVVSNGLLSYDSILSAGGRQVRWDMNSACATNLLTFAVGPYHKLDYGLSSGAKPQVVYAKSSDTASARITFKKLPAAVSALEALYGPYPFEKVGYVITGKGSMEHQTMIAFARGELGLKDTINKNVAHELAHQWFGDLVTPYDYRDAWLCESFATYSECAWYENVGGKVRYLADTKRKTSVYLADVARLGGKFYEGILSIYDFSRKSPSSNYPQVIYLKGAVVLAQLRYLVGDEAFYGAIRRYLAKHAHANAVYDDVVDSFVESVSLQQQDSVRSYFQQWVKGKGWPLLDIRCEKSAHADQTRAILHIEQQQHDTLGVYTWFPLELSFKDAAGKLVHRVLRVTSKTQDFVLDSLNDFQSIAVNSGESVNSLVTLTRTAVITSVDNDQQSSKLLRIHPNPCNEVLWIEYPQDSPCIVEIIDQLAKRVLVREVKTSTEVLVPLDVQELPSGFYVARVRSAHGMSATSFTISR